MHDLLTCLRVRLCANSDSSGIMRQKAMKHNKIKRKRKNILPLLMPGYFYKFIYDVFQKLKLSIVFG